VIAAGHFAGNAVTRGLRAKPWVKTSLSPGSRVVTDYVAAAGLLEPLAELGFHVTGYACMTCGGMGVRCRPRSSTRSARETRRRRGPLRQPQFRGAHPRRGAGELSWITCARRRLRARGLDGCRSRPWRVGGWAMTRPAGVAHRALARPGRFAASSSWCCRPSCRKRYAAFDAARWEELPTPAGATFAWKESSYLKCPPFLDGFSSEPSRRSDVELA
jgi:aconitate hydratase A / 2-methylisocitrate dehydratase